MTTQDRRDHLLATATQIKTAWAALRKITAAPRCQYDGETAERLDHLAHVALTSAGLLARYLADYVSALPPSPQAAKEAPGPDDATH